MTRVSGTPLVTAAVISIAVAVLVPVLTIGSTSFKCPSASVYKPCKCFTWGEKDQLHKKSNPSQQSSLSRSTTVVSSRSTTTLLAATTESSSSATAAFAPPAPSPARNESTWRPTEAPVAPSSAFETEVEISCRTMATDEVSLESLFSRLVDHIQREDLITRFTSLRIENTALGSVDGSDMFHGISFKSLDFFQNVDLDTFDLRSFNQSYGTLETMLLSGSPFRGSEEFFREVSRFTKLETLILSHNHIEGLPDQAFGQTLLPNLAYIDLQGNQIREIGSKTFYGLPSVQRITLDNNLISRISNETFLFREEKSKLLLIFLRNNNLTAESFEPFAFANTDKTIFLYLNGNQISYLREDIFKPMLEQKNDLFIALWSNPFSCDCRSKWLLQEKIYYRKRLHGIKCLDKKEIWDLEEEDLTC